VGIGANTAIFSLVNAILLRELPLKAPEELVNIYIATPDFPYNVFSYPDFRDLRDGTEDAFAGVSASRLILAQVDRDGRIEMLPGEAVSGNYFSLLGVEAQVGRTILREDDVAPGAHPVVVLSHRYWQSAFGGEPDVVGQEIRLSGRPYTILGIAPADYTGNFRGIEPAIYTPMMMINELLSDTYDELEARGNHSIFVKARRRPGVTMAQAQVAVDAVATRLGEDDIEDWDPQGAFLLVPTEEVVLYPPFDRFVRAAAWLLIVVVGLVLLMACMNLASFLLARALDRRKEIALRLALGATRRTLVGQLLTETVVLGLLGGVAGVALAVWLLRLLLAADLPLPLPVTLDLSLDATVLGFSLMVSLTAGILLGLVPAFQSTNPDLASTLKDETAGAGRSGRWTLRNALVVAQVAASLVLLVGAGLFLRSFQRVQSVDPGFGRDPAAILTVMVPATRFSDEKGRIFTRTMVERFQQLPGVEAVGITDNLHLNTLSTQNKSFNVDGVEPPPDREAHTADRANVDAGFFDATGIRILRGRNFSDTDLPDSPPVAIISEAMARKFWSSAEGAIGRTIRLEDDPDLLVVGVASDAKVRSVGESPRSFIYLPYSQRYSSFLTVVARTSLDAEPLARELLATGRQLDPELWVWEATTMERHLGIVLLPARLSALLLSVFAVLALALASIGLYGVVSYAVSQRTREVGIRMSLGADAGSVVRMVMAGGLKLIAVGGAIGLMLALGVSRLVSGLLFGINALDPFTFLAVPAVLGGAAILAAYIPARRASRVDPVTALRAE
jgi:predicted permease